MTTRTNLLAAIALVAATASPALARWQWVEDAPAPQADTQIYEERTAPNYYSQQPRAYAHQPEPAYVTDRETFRDGGCEITRTHLSDGTSSDDRICTRTRLMLPHEFIIDRLGRAFDHLRGYDGREPF